MSSSGFCSKDLKSEEERERESEEEEEIPSSRGATIVYAGPSILQSNCDSSYDWLFYLNYLCLKFLLSEIDDKLAVVEVMDELVDQEDFSDLSDPSQRSRAFGASCSVRRGLVTHPRL